MMDVLSANKSTFGLNYIIRLVKMFLIQVWKKVNEPIIIKQLIMLYKQCDLKINIICIYMKWCLPVSTMLHRSVVQKQTLPTALLPLNVWSPSTHKTGSTSGEQCVAVSKYK